MLGSHAALAGRCPAERAGARGPQQDVIHENDAEADREAGKPAIFAVADPECEGEETQNGACAGERKLLMDHEPLTVAVAAVLLGIRGACSQFGDRHFRIAFHQLDPRENRFGIHRQQQRVEGLSFVFIWLSGKRRMARPACQRQLHRALAAIDEQATLAGEVHRRLVGAGRVSEKNILPAAGRRLVADVEHAIGKRGVEHARLDVALGL